ncbi:MAG: hypothetical protein RIS31_204, partial [Actinomycetota bacterium]
IDDVSSPMHSVKGDDWNEVINTAVKSLLSI